jgi:hypothetical protein
MGQVYTLDIRLKARDPYQDHDVYTMLYVNDSSVVLSENVKRVGITKGGKTWVRFEPREKTIIRLAEYPDGRPRVNVFRVQQKFMGERGRGQKRGYTFDMTPATIGNSLARNSEFHSVLAGEFIKMYEARYGATGLLPLMSSIGKLAYPILRDHDRWLYQRPLGGALRQTSGRAFIEHAFGKTRYRKDLMKAVADSYWLEPVSMAHEFRGLVPIDWIVDFIRNAPKHAIDLPLHGEQWGNLRKIAKLTDPRSARRLMEGLLAPGNTAMLVTDSIRSMRAIHDREAIPELGRVESWRQVHDELAMQARRAVNPNKPIPQKHKIVKALDGLELRNEADIEYRFESAKMTDDMDNWGAIMGHCIGSYMSTAVAERGFYFAIYKDGRLYANAEVSPDGSVRQLYGRFNQTPPERKWLKAEIAKVVPSNRIEYNPEFANAYIVPANAIANPAAPRVAELRAGIPIPIAQPGEW